MAAEKYNLPKLKSMAEKSLCKTLTVKSVIWTCAFAHIHNGHSVVQAATEMIVAHFADVIQQAEWTDFVKNNPESSNQHSQKTCQKFLLTTVFFI
jgi:hypothetical protein